MKTLFVALLSLSSLCAGQAVAESMAPAGANVYIVSPGHGEVVSSPIKIVFGLTGMGVAPAGVQRDNTGHHHLLIDTAVPDLGKPIPADANHMHFGAGQTEVVLQLAPGKHTLQLLLADYAHLPHKPPALSEQITITVQ